MHASLKFSPNFCKLGATGRPIVFGDMIKIKITTLGIYLFVADNVVVGLGFSILHSHTGY